MSDKMTTCELREKDVINLCGGSKLGHACDFEFDACDGRICALIVSRATGFLGFGGAESCIVPGERIECLGEDAVLVKVPQNELCACEHDRRRDKKRK